MSILVSVVDKIAWLPFIIACGQFSALAFLWLWVWKRRECTPTLAQFLLIVMTARFLLFGTPLSWFTYYATIDSNFVDPRERDIIANKIKTFFLPPPQQKFLAVGSSQTRAVYSHFSKHNPILGYYTLAGMQPADFVDEYTEIVKRRPKVVLLYISEFDLGRQVDLSTSRLSDLSIKEWPNFYRSAAAAAGPKKAWDTMVAIAIADLFPENKYSFIFKDYFKQLRSRFLGARETPPTFAQQIRLERNSLNNLRADAVPAELIFLDEFLKLAERDRIPVVLVEGQYNPVAYNDKNVPMNRNVIEPALAKLQKTFPNVTLVRRADLRQFNESDYQDAYHVKAEAGDRFVTQLLALLERREKETRLNRRSLTLSLQHRE